MASAARNLKLDFRMNRLTPEQQQTVERLMRRAAGIARALRPGNDDLVSDSFLALCEAVLDPKCDTDKKILHRVKSRLRNALRNQWRNPMTERESAETKRAWREMCRSYAQMTMALAQMAKGAAVFRAGAALGDVKLDPQIPDLLNSASYDSALNNFVRQCVAAGIIKTNDEGLRHVNYKRV